MNRIKQFISEHKKKLTIALVVVMALSLPFIVNQVLKQQDVRQRADSAPAIKIYFGDTQVLTPTPVPNGTIRVGDIINISLKVDTGTNDIGGIQYKITYPTGFINNISSTIHPGFIQLSKTAVDGNFEVAMVNPTINQITGLGLDLTNFQFQAIKAGTFTLTVSQIKATASRFDTFVPIDPSSILTKAITITEGGTTISISPSPIGDECTSLSSGRSLDCHCTLDSQCSSNKCRVSEDPANNKCVPYLTPTLTPSPSPTPIRQGDIPVPTPTHTPTPTNTPTPTQAPTNTPIPTATIPIGQTSLNITASVTGIGIGQGFNNEPLHPNRTIDVAVYDFTTKALKGTFQVQSTYDPAIGKFKAQMALNDSIVPASGAYDIKIKMNNTLQKKISGIYINKDAVNSYATNFALVPSDLDQNNTLNINDYTLAAGCLKVVDPAPSCTDEIRARFDLNDNGITKGDTVDFHVMQIGFATILQGDE